MTSFIINSASLAIAQDKGVRYKYVSLPEKAFVKHNETGPFHNFCSVLTMYSGNENEKAKEKKKTNRIVSDSNTDLTLNKIKVCKSKKQIWVFQIPAKAR